MRMNVKNNPKAPITIAVYYAESDQQKNIREPESPYPGFPPPLCISPIMPKFLKGPWFMPFYILL
jgi:hypothetical protein